MGCGKSTLGRLLTMIERCNRRRALLSGPDFCSGTIRRRRSCVARKSRLCSRTRTVL
ncbi:hypothetical protein ACVXG7_11400 [Enterobacter hormaechei]